MVKLFSNKWTPLFLVIFRRFQRQSSEKQRNIYFNRLGIAGMAHAIATYFNSFSLFNHSLSFSFTRGRTTIGYLFQKKVSVFQITRIADYADRLHSVLL